MFRIDPHAQARPQPAPSAFPKTKRIIPPARYANAHAEAMRRIQEDALRAERAARDQSTAPSPPPSDAASSDSNSESDTDSEEEEEARDTSSFIKPAYVSLFFGWFGATAKQSIPPDLQFHFPDENDSSKLPHRRCYRPEREQEAADNRPATQTHTARKSFPLTPNSEPEPARVGRSSRPPIPDFSAAPPLPSATRDDPGSAAPRPPRPPRGKRLYKTTSLSRDEMKEQLFRERSERNRRIQEAMREEAQGEEARREEARWRAEREEEARHRAEEERRCAERHRAAQEERRRLAAEIAQRQREVEAELQRQRAAAAERDAENRRRQAEAEENERQRRTEIERQRRRLEEQMRDLREKVERSKAERARQEEQAGAGRTPHRPGFDARARAAADAARAQRLRREESAFKRMAGRWDARERHRGSSSPLKRTPTPTAHLTPRERYEVLWTRLLSPPTPDTRPFTFTSFPWPGGRTVVEIAKFLLSGPGVEGGKERYVIRQQLKRWHPDKFATAVMAQGRVVEADRERVLEGQKAVVLALNELLARF